jgi:hypothetical protein
MKSFANAKFWELYTALPATVQKRADRAYALWQINPHARGLYFKRVSERRPIYSVRIDRGYRALGLLMDDSILWFWIGSHDEYERLLKQL